MERIRYYNVDTLTDLSKVKFSAAADDSAYFTYSDTTPHEGAPDVAWHSVCSVAPVGQIYSHGKFYFPGKAGYSGTVYGVQWDTTDPSPECTRIGNLSLHATLPVQSQMVGGLMLDDGTFNEFGNQSDWTSYTRDGSLGQVMVKIPTFWIKFETLGDIYRVLMSAVPVVGFKTVREMYVSAYEASLDRTDLKLSSVVNKTAQYRGGNNQSAWDNEDTAGVGGESHRSLLGRPATSISLTDFRNYARKRGSTAWNCYFYLMHKILYWLYVVEYATLNSQKAFNASLDSNGFHQGGLGDGVSNWSWTSWGNFNNNYPFVPCGWTDEYGNATSVKNYIVYDTSGTALKNSSVPRYRGIENPFGHIWKHTDGILIDVTASTSDIYTTDEPDEFNSTSYDDYDFVGHEWRSSDYQYIKELHLGANGDITAKSGVGNSSSYYCDAHYTTVDSTGLRAVLFAGAVSAGTVAGFVYSHSNGTPSRTNAYVGSRLTYFDAWRDVVYEEYEWLKGDGDAYIDTNVIVNTATLKLKFNCYNISNTAGCICGSRNTASLGTDTTAIHFQNSQYRLDIISAHPNYQWAPKNTFDSFDVDLSTNIVTVSETTITSNKTHTNSSNTFRVFGCALASTGYSGGLNDFIIDDGLHIFNFVPCKLLQPIPAILDGNGIARAAGECGMWDKVGNKFYGNVAESGKFTVEGQRLYEEFDWLCGRNGAYIDTTYHPIVGTDVFSVHFRYDGTTRNPDNGEQDAFGANYIVSDQRNFIRAFINSGNRLSCSYYEYAGTWPSTEVYSKEWDIANLMIDGSNFKYVANGTDYSFANNDMQQQTCPVSLFVFKNNDTVYNQNCYLHGDIAFFKITDTSSNVKMHLTPVRLLRPLPAYMDANGKSRAAGECGMWDKVGNKFYGNVASSGRFTVLNN